MLYYKKLENVKTDRETVVTLGKFDGVHSGHRELLKEVFALSKENGLSTCVFTFNVIPQARLAHKKSMSILSNDERRRFLDRIGIDMMVECPFTDNLRNLEPEEFIKNVLIDILKARAVVVGDDFRFGKDRKGTPDLLKEAGKRLGIEVRIIKKITYEGREISSTYIREELVEGNIEKVNTLLGYPFYAEGVVVHGERNGHILGFPTANIIPDEHKILPPKGVYHTRVKLGDDVYKGITNIGIRPTLDGKKISIETNIMNYDKEIYGEFIKVEFLKFTRPEKHFASLDELKEQISRDIAEMNKY